MQRSQTIRPLIRLASYIVALILVLLPFHALFTTWAGSNFGHLDLFRIWKELLMVPLGLFAAWLVYYDKAFQKQLARSWLIRCIAAYSIMFILFAAFALISNRATPTAIIYSLITSLRFLWWFLIVWVITKSDPFVNQQWLKLLLVPASLVVLFGLLQKFLLPTDFLRHFGYGSDTIPAVQTVDEKTSYQRVQSTLRGANPLGAYLVAVISAIVASLRRKKWLAFLLAAAAVVLFFTYSRSAWIGMVVSLAVLGFLQLSSRRGKQVMVISFALAFVLGVGAIWQFQHNDVLQNTVFHSDENSQSAVSSNEMRTDALVAATKDVIAEPLGRGPGTAGPASFRNDQPARISENYFLQIGQEVGIVGLLLVLAIFGLTARALWLRRRYVLAQVLLASLAGITVINLMSHAWTDDTLSLLWWGFAGAVMSLPAILSTELRHETKKKQKHLKKSQRRELIQIAQYLVSGGAWFWSGYFIIVFMTPVIGLWWANLLGNGVGLTLNFILERNWVFTGSKTRKTTQVTSRYVVYTGCNFILNYFILLGLQKLGIPVAIGQFVASGFFTVWNYLWYRLWVFKGTPHARRVRHHA